MKKLVGYFFQGVIYIVPITITFYVLINIFNLIDKGTKSFIAFFLGADNPIISLPGLGILSLLLFVTFFGYIGTFLIAKPVLQYFQDTLQRTPLIKVIYTSVKDFVYAFVGKEKKFTEAVMVCMNKDSNVYKLGFVTSKDLSNLGIEKNMVGVYFPHSYGFTGNFFIVAAEHVTPIHAKSADVMKFIFSGGVSTMQAPQNNNE